MVSALYLIIAALALVIAVLAIWEAVSAAAGFIVLVLLSLWLAIDIYLCKVVQTEWMNIKDLDRSQGHLRHLTHSFIMHARNMIELID